MVEYNFSRIDSQMSLYCEIHIIVLYDILFLIHSNIYLQYLNVTNASLSNDVDDNIGQMSFNALLQSHFNVYEF